MPKKTLSRRDAIKLLGAATGATLLANLPSKWSTPELTSGVLPAHAQTSTSLGLQILSCDFNLDIGTGVWSSTPNVGPMPIPNISIPMGFTITFVNTHFAGSSDPQSPNPYINNWNLSPSTGTVLYANNANVALSNAGLMLRDSGALNGSVTILWEFLSPTHGFGSCSQTVDWIIIP